MNEIAKKDILDIISKTIEILKVKEEKDVIELKDLSNHTIHNASIYQDEDSVSIAILVYSLSKLIERKHGAINAKSILNMLKISHNYLKIDNTQEYRRSIKKLFSLISKIDNKLKLYVQEVIRQAQIRKGSQLYRHGISLARAAEILRVSQWEMMDYLGQTQIIDKADEKLDVESRLKFARWLFT